jgi:hypothetical protein
VCLTAFCFRHPGADTDRGRVEPVGDPDGKRVLTTLGATSNLLTIQHRRQISPRSPHSTSTKLYQSCEHPTRRRSQDNPLTPAPSRSRLIFRNLPPTLTPDTFRSHLTTPPNLRSSTTITDTKLVPKRRFAFVGYKTDDEARRVKEWFDGSFSFGGGKVQVEFVRDEVGPRIRRIT